MRKQTPLKMIPVGAIASGVQGLAGIASGIIGSKKRKNEERKAQAQYNRYKQQYENMDTSNPYANMENVYEDATINTQAADMTKQQQMEGMASTMDQFAQSAGGSGIAALAQAMAGQQAANAQTASADIANQEQQIQQAQMGEASRLQGLDREGQLMSRQAEFDKMQSLMQMSQDRLGAAKQARADATSSLMSGVAGVTSAAGQVPGIGKALGI